MSNTEIEQLKAESEFKETLLGISQAVSDIKDRSHLLKIIFKQVKPIFGFHDMGLFVLSEDKQTFTDWAQDEPDISPSFGNEFLNESAVPRYPYAGTHIEKLLDKAVKSKTPMLGSYRDAEMKAYLIQNMGAETYEQLIDKCYNDFMLTELTYDGKILGALLFNKSKGTFAKAKFPLFLAIVDQIAVAVSNILANEKLIAEKQLTEKLLNISQAITEVKDRKQLLQTIYNRIKPIFPHDSYGLFVLTEDKKYHYELVDAESMSNDPIQVSIEEKYGAHYQFSHGGSIVEKMMHQGPGLFLVTDFLEHPQAPHMYNAGLRQLIAGPLSHGGEIIGMLCFSSKQKDFYSKKHLSFFKAISEQVSIATSNILANEKLLGEKQKTEDLLAVTEAIANITSGPELVRSIFDKLQMVFPFDEAGLFHLDWENEKERDLVVDYAYETTVANEDIKDAEITGWMPMTDLSKKVSRDTLVMPIDDFYTKYDHPHFEFTKTIPFTHIICGPLKQGNQVIGLLYFWSKGESFENKVSLFKSITDQMSVALSNIIANEQLIKEKNFKETLLEITEAVAQVRNEKTLFETIYSRVQPLFQFQSLDIVLYQDDTMQVLHQPSKDYEYTQDLKDYLQDPIPLAGTPFQDFFDSKDEFKQVDLDEWVLQYPDFEGPKLAQKAGLTEVWLSKLYHGGEFMGCINLVYKNAPQFTSTYGKLLENLSQQIAVAIVNILKNQEIQNEKEFKETLLEITRAIAQIRDSETLFKIIYEQIKPIFEFDGLLVLLLHGEHFQVQYCNIENEALKTFISHPIAISGSPFEEVFESNEPFFKVNVKEWLKKYPKYPGAQVAFEEGMREIWLSKLFHRGTMIGCVELLHRNPPKFSFTYKRLMENLSQQLAVTLNNIQANEEVQFRERIKALEANLLNAMNEGEEREEKLFAIAKTLNEHLQSDLFVFYPHQGMEYFAGNGFEQIGPGEFRIIDTSKFLEMSGLSEAKFSEFLKNNRYKKTQLANGNDFEKLASKDGILRTISATFKVRHCLLLPLHLSRTGQQKMLFHFGLYRKKGMGYTVQDKMLLEQIKSSLELGMERQIAYQEIKLLNERLESEKEYLEDELDVKYNFNEIIGSSSAMELVFEKVNLVINTDTTVLILGETGTGKELIARALHNASSRKDENFIKVNCATLPSELIESELFGHEKGSFTGAQKQRIGKFELAHNGTIFLDEIGELPLELQAKLLRVLQEKEFERLGGNKTLKTSARIIAATNRDLQKEATEGKFRSDLYFRLSVFPILLPPLREREDDVIELAEFFLKKFSKKVGKRVTEIMQKDRLKLNAYNWPGNVRELEHIMERSVLLSEGPKLNIALELGAQSQPTYEQPFVPKTLDEAERDVILKTLKLTNGRVSGPEGAAKILNVKPSTLEYRIKRAGIEKKEIFS